MCLHVLPVRPRLPPPPMVWIHMPDPRPVVSGALTYLVSRPFQRSRPCSVFTHSLLVSEYSTLKHREEILSLKHMHQSASVHIILFKG